MQEEPKKEGRKWKILHQGELNQANKEKSNVQKVAGRTR